MLGFHLTDYERKTPEHERWVERLGKDTVVCNTHEGLPERGLRRSAMRNRLRSTGPGKDLLIETHWYFRTYDLAQARRLFRRAGPEVLAVSGGAVTGQHLRAPPREPLSARGVYRGPSGDSRATRSNR